MHRPVPIQRHPRPVCALAVWVLAATLLSGSVAAAVSSEHETLERALQAQSEALATERARAQALQARLGELEGRAAALLERLAYQEAVSTRLRERLSETLTPQAPAPTFSAAPSPATAALLLAAAWGVGWAFRAVLRAHPGLALGLAALAAHLTCRCRSWRRYAPAGPRS